MTDSQKTFCKAEDPGATPCGNFPSGRFFRSVKTYGHEEGLSCCFLQWKAQHSHCRFLHGYALSFTFVFAAYELDHHGWCMDFGGLKKVRQWLHETFDHKLIASQDDPGLDMLKKLDEAGLCQLRILPAVGCEAFAWHSWRHINALVQKTTQNRVHVESVQVREHAGNSAIYLNKNSPAPPMHKERGTTGLYMRICLCEKHAFKESLQIYAAESRHNNQISKRH